MPLPENFTMQDLQEWVMHHDARWNYPNEESFHNLVHYGLALAEESGEVAGVIKKRMRAEDREVPNPKDPYTDPEHFKGRFLEEMVDVAIYFPKIIIAAGFTLEDFREAWHAKFHVLHQRYDLEHQEGVPCELCSDEVDASA